MCTDNIDNKVLSRESIKFPRFQSCLLLAAGKMLAHFPKQSNGKANQSISKQAKKCKKDAESKKMEDVKKTRPMMMKKKKKKMKEHEKKMKGHEKKKKKKRPRDANQSKRHIVGTDSLFSLLPRGYDKLRMQIFLNVEQTIQVTLLRMFGFTKPIIITDQKDMEMRMPSPLLGIHEICENIGLEVEVPVKDRTSNALSLMSCNSGPCTFETFLAPSPIS